MDVSFFLSLQKGYLSYQGLG